MKVLLLLVLLCGLSCVGKYDRMYVKDSKGQMYYIEWCMVDVYFVRKVKMPKEWVSK